MRLSAEYDRERYWEADGSHSHGEWLSWFLDIGVGTGRDWACTARRLENRPGIADAFADGDLSYDQVRVLVRSAKPDTDETWAEQGQRYTPAELERIARRRRPVSPEESEDAHADRWLKYRWDHERRSVRGEFDLPEDAGAIFVKGLERQVDEQLEVARSDPEAERVPYPARLADAVVELAARRIGADSDPDRATIVIGVPGAALTGVCAPDFLLTPTASSFTARSRPESPCRRLVAGVSVWWWGVPAGFWDGRGRVGTRRVVSRLGGERRRRRQRSNWATRSGNPREHDVSTSDHHHRPEVRVGRKRDGRAGNG